MAKLRCVKVTRLCLFDPAEGENSAVVLGNLQTLSQAHNFRWSKEILERIPNLKKLGVIYKLEESDWKHHCLENLMYLQKLVALTCTFLEPCPSLLHILTSPPSLKKLSLEKCGLPWKDMKILGWLSNLEVLKLRKRSFADKEWEFESTEEEFPKLKFLLLQELDIGLWIANSVNFPNLERLIIKYCEELEEIPRRIGDIPRLPLIELYGCRYSLGDLVKEMQEEQMEFGNDGLETGVSHQLLFLK